MFKHIQFIVVAVNLYKEMIQNQKRIIELLKFNVNGKGESGTTSNIKCLICHKQNAIKYKTQPSVFVVCQVRAYGGCLDTKRRRRTL